MNYISKKLFRNKKERERLRQRKASINMPHIPPNPLLITSASPWDNLQNHSEFDLGSVSPMSFFWSPLTFVFSFYYCFGSYPIYLTKVT